MAQKRRGVLGWRGIGLATWMGYVLSGCGGDGPTGPAPASLPDLFGEELYRADASPVSVSALDGEALIGIYFASASCPACGAFTPVLVDAYSQLQEGGRSFEVVLVTFGITDAAMFEFMTDSEMPWLAIPPSSQKVDALLQRYDVLWVPTLIVIDAAGNTVSLTGREDVMEEGASAYDVWLATGAGS